MNTLRLRQARSHAGPMAALSVLAGLWGACGDGSDDSTEDKADAGPDLGGPTDPLNVPSERTWTWFDFPDAYCRDGSPASIAVSTSATSKNLMIYLEGGGSCFDSLTCLANPANTQLLKMNKTVGIFNRAKAENPVADWNYVYVPYCTGDVHSGTNPDGVVSGLAGTQKFVGYTNMGVFLKRIAPTFPGTEHVLLVGVSAGGFGAATNVPQVLRAFPDAQGTLIDDSGPPMSSKYLPSCLQQKWRDTWGLDKSILAECGTDCANHDDFTLDYGVHLAKTYSDHKSGTIESNEDDVIRRFFGVGANDCTGSFIAQDPGVSGPDFTAGLLEFRDAVKAYPNFGTYFPVSHQHTWLGDDTSLYDTTVNGTKLIDWVTGIVNDDAVSHVGP